MKVACLFPGQGSQYVGMGRDLWASYPAAKTVFEEADRILGFGLSGICFEGPEERLRETRYTQPAILVHSLAVWRIFREAGFRPDFVAGHSVGEYAALVAGGALTFKDALFLVRERAEAMYAAGVEHPGAMAAIIGMPEGNLDRFIENYGRTGVLAAANYNSPVQVVISGQVEPVKAAVAGAKEFGAKRAIMLNVSGAFHSPLMEAARQRLSACLHRVEFGEAWIPVVSNVTAGAVTDPEEIVSLLERQLTSPVLWYQSMRYLGDHGVSSFAELGPGTVLCGLLKRIAPEARCVSCADGVGITECLKEVSA
jgi:[acyl-carrier-protein] S-malonyltransferase